MAEVVRGRIDRNATAAHAEAWTAVHVEVPDRPAFREVAETELLSAFMMATSHDTRSDRASSPHGRRRGAARVMIGAGSPRAPVAPG